MVAMFEKWRERKRCHGMSMLYNYIGHRYVFFSIAQKCGPLEDRKCTRVTKIAVPYGY